MTRDEAIDVLAQWVVAAAYDYTEGDSYASFVEGLSAQIIDVVSNRADEIAARPDRSQIEAARAVLTAD